MLHNFEPILEKCFPYTGNDLYIYDNEETFINEFLEHSFRITE